MRTRLIHMQLYGNMRFDGLRNIKIPFNVLPHG